MKNGQSVDASELVALFPLPNCVLLPRAVIPLHIFEPRYREMTADCLKGTPQLAMALLIPGYEPRYYSNVAAIYPIVCVGQIVRHEMLDDGRYNILLQGVVRAEVVAEDRTRSYRRARVAVRPTTGVAGDESSEAIRRQLAALLSEPPISTFAGECNWRQLVESKDLPVSDVVDYLANAVSCDVECARRFLEETDLARRSRMLFAEIKDFARRLELAGDSGCSRPWPRRLVTN